MRRRQLIKGWVETHRCRVAFCSVLKELEVSTDGRCTSPSPSRSKADSAHIVVVETVEDDEGDVVTRTKSWSVFFKSVELFPDSFGTSAPLENHQFVPLVMMDAEFVLGPALDSLRRRMQLSLLAPRPYPRSAVTKRPRSLCSFVDDSDVEGQEDQEEPEEPSPPPRKRCRFEPEEVSFRTVKRRRSLDGDGGEEEEEPPRKRRRLEPVEAIFRTAKRRRSLDDNGEEEEEQEEHVEDEPPRKMYRMESFVDEVQVEMPGRGRSPDHVCGPLGDMGVGKQDQEPPRKRQRTERVSEAMPSAPSHRSRAPLKSILRPSKYFGSSSVQQPSSSGCHVHFESTVETRTYDVGHEKGLRRTKWAVRGRKRHTRERRAARKKLVELCILAQSHRNKWLCDIHGVLQGACFSLTREAEDVHTCEDGAGAGAGEDTVQPEDDNDDFVSIDLSIDDGVEVVEDLDTHDEVDQDVAEVDPMPRGRLPHPSHRPASPRRSPRLRCQNLGSGFTESGRRFSLRMATQQQR